MRSPAMRATALSCLPCWCVAHGIAMQQQQREPISLFSKMDGCPTGIDLNVLKVIELLILLPWLRKATSCLIWASSVENLAEIYLYCMLLRLCSSMLHCSR